MALRPESVQQNIALRRSHLVRGRVVGLGLGVELGLGLGLRLRRYGQGQGSG